MGLGLGGRGLTRIHCPSVCPFVLMILLWSIMVWTVNHGVVNHVVVMHGVVRHVLSLTMVTTALWTHARRQFATVMFQLPRLGINAATVQMEAEYFFRSCRKHLHRIDLNLRVFVTRSLHWFARLLLLYLCSLLTCSWQMRAWASSACAQIR